MGLFLLILAMAGGTYYAMRASDGEGGSGGPYADLSFRDLVDLLLAQKDVAERWYSNPDYMPEGETRESLNYVYSEGKTEERVMAALAAYAEARNVRGNMKMDSDGKSSVVWNKSDRKPFTKKTVEILLELSDRFEVAAAKGEKSESKLGFYERMMGDERAAIDKAASGTAVSDGDVATKADLDAALATFEKTSVAEACLNLDGNFGFEARKVWDGMGDPADQVSLEFYATALDVEITGTTLSKPSKCTGALDGPSSDALMRLADLFTNRAISTAADPAAVAMSILDGRKRIDLVAATTSSYAAPEDTYVEPSGVDYTAPIGVVSEYLAEAPTDYAVSYTPPTTAPEPKSIFETDTGLPTSSFVKPAYIPLGGGSLGPGGFGAGVPASRYSMAPYTTDIGPREDHGPGRVWS